ncbi:MAG TPA: fibronectin type III domain-containing protein [Candidatus Binatia bacterium]|nr:fibronectin type III domain-containing protein [Candidatus Binatia bacterium]
MRGWEESRLVVQHVNLKFWIWMSSALWLVTLSAQGRSIALAWEASSDETVIGYKLYYGIESGSYSNSLDVGRELECTLHDLPEETTFYFAVTAYNNFGLESDFSTEVSYRVDGGIDPGDGPFEIGPLGSPPLGEGCTVTWQSHPGYIYRVLSRNGINQPWSVCTPDIRSTGTISSWTDFSATNCAEFYTVEMFPIEPVKAPFTIRELRPTWEGKLEVSWNSEPGWVYRVLSTSNLANPTWVVRSENIAATTADTTWVDDTAFSDPTRFYVIEVVVAPMRDVPFKITSLSSSGGVTIVRWESQPGVTYRVHARESLTEGDWVPISEDIIAIDPITPYVDIPRLAKPVRYFKIERIPPE